MTSLKHTMELLAPAGGSEQLHAAVAFGADAVYLAGPDFGMRARAANFSLDEIASAAQFAHSKSVQVFATCNIMINENDLKSLPSYLESLNAAGIDALIIGDLGAFSLAKKYAPSCKLHVSTQASVANSEAAKMWHSLGASRIVCAREMTLADITKMRSEIPDDLELEAFVHGAQCMAMSSRCLISAYMAGRSGNRGDCTQPCRWNYSLVEETRPGEFIEVDEDSRGTYIMNAMDLCMIEHLFDLQQAGVNSIKIEGRNKKAFYVASVVGAYRKALDAISEGSFTPELCEMLLLELNAVSHRPYSTGFFYGDPKQAADYEGYEQETLHVADVLACAESGDGGYKLTCKIRNRLSVGDTLEVLSPRDALRKFEVRAIDHLGAATDDTWGFSGASLGAVDVANRAAEIYSIACPFKVEPGSFLRRREHRRTTR